MKTTISDQLTITVTDSCGLDNDYPIFEFFFVHMEIIYLRF